jgi:DNA-binding XRE family transcriptional regulator
MTRYVTRRIGGSWQVQDTHAHNFVMGEYGAGSGGYRTARAVADGLNEQPPPPRRNDWAPASNNNNLRSSAGLRAWRQAHKLSQQKLADLLEVHKLTVLRWETGQVAIPRTTELALLYLNHTLSTAAPASAAV